MTAPADGLLFTPTRLGSIDLRNRIAMAPLTRNRAIEGRVPTPLSVQYYQQRASAGLIIAEATQISPLGQGYLDTPGIYSQAQIDAWRKVTDAVHAEGGRIILQLWHVGRISHTSLLPEGEVPVAPSAVRADAKTFTANGFEDVSAPRALALEEIPALVQDYRQAARNAITAGFDGVEVHAANGYLIDQFLRDGSNLRTDEYGGSIENRTRLLDEVVRAVAAEIGAERTGVRLSPTTPAGDAHDSAPQPLFERAVERLDAIGHLAFVHVIEGATGGPRDNIPFDYAALRAKFRGPWIANNGYDKDSAEAAVERGYADVIAFGRPFIANPDLVERLRFGVPLSEFNPDTLYGGGAEGYTDYPSVSGSNVAE